MSALQGMDMLMYSYEEECIPLNAPLAWFEYGLELSYCVLSTSILPSLQKIDSSFCYDVQFGTCLIMSSLNDIFFIVSGTSMNHSFYIISGTVVYLLNTFSGTLVCVIVSGTAVYLFHRQWYVGESSLFYIISGTVVYLFHAFSGTLVCVIVSGTAVHLFHRQWYVDELHLLLYHQWYGGISLSCLQWNIGMCYRQWYGGTSLSSSVVRR